MTLALLITAATGAWASGEIVVTVTAADLQADLSNPFTKDGVTIKCSDRMTGGLAFNELNEMSTTLGYFTKIEITNQFPEGISGLNGVNGFSVNGSVATWTGKASSVGMGHYSVGPVEQFVFTIEPAGVDVTINEAKTEASFKMPQYDVTATYTLKRDLSVETQVTVGDDHDAQPRYRVQKQGNTFQPVGMDQAQVMALFHVHDQIEDQDLAATEDYTVQIYAVDIEGQPTGDAITFQNFTYAPGQYIVKAVAKDGSNYSGETALSNVFTLFQGYEVEVPAKEFITYYKDEPLYVEDEDAVLYTITSVNGDQAVLSDKSDAMPSNTPMLVYNKSNETKVILLIPCAEPDMAITVAPEFQGTLTGTTIAASTEGQTNYAFNGKAFVFVKNDLAIAANKAWLEIGSGAAGARSVVLVFSDSLTGVNLTPALSEGEGAWYDLSGRKLQGKPTKSGVYINNGKKVTIK